jgi:alginate O-acetyltransferase complex protein AlgJ
MARFNYYLRLFEIWLLFPATWFFFYSLDSSKPGEKSDTVFYTSVKAPKGSTIDLFKGKTFMIRMHPTGNCFNPLQYEGKIKFIDSLNIRVSGVSEKDTVSFLAINLFKKNIVHTLPEIEFQSIAVDSATICDTTSHLLSYVPDKNVHTFTLNLPDARYWSHPDISPFKMWVLISVFLLLLIILVIVRPSHKYLFIITGLSCMFIGFYWWLGRDTASRLSIKNDTPLKGVVIYYDSIPEFVPEMCTLYHGNDSIFQTQVNLSMFPYYRININKDIAFIKNFGFNYGFGLISKNRNLNAIKPSEVITNDLNYNGRTSTWAIAGNDPYICLTTSTFITSLNKILFLRNSLFLFIAALLFIAGLLFKPMLSGLAVHKTLFISAFFAILFNSLLLWFFNSNKFQLEAEKRPANKFPVYDSLSIPEYMKKLGLYVQDQLPGRSSLIVSNNFIKYESFGQVPGNPFVYFGKDGWMFYIGENTDEMYENKHPLTDDELLKMKNLLVGREEWLKKRNIHYYLIFPRLPHFIYNEKIGPGLNVYTPKPKLSQLLEYLKKNTTLDVIDVEKPILDAKAGFKKNVYYSNDTHWTAFGAYFAYEAIINYIRKDFPNMPPAIPFDKIKWGEGYDDNADLAKLVCLSTVIKRHIYFPVNKRIGNFSHIRAPDYPEFRSMYPMQFCQSKDTLAPRLLMFRDSYANALIPYFATNFSRQGYLWTPFFYPTIIEKEKPNIVITEMSEKSIYELLNDIPPIDAIPNVTTQANAKH